VSLGVTVELLHIALLLHDRVRDDDTRADVRPDDEAKWARNTSVLRGDYLLATAVGTLSADGNISFLSDLIDVVRQMCEGQARFLRTRGSLLATEEYLDALRMRTGALPAFAARAGFLVAGGPPQYAEAFHAFGERFGVAFHLAGEILDLIEDRPESLERVLARDGWRTLPVAVTARIGERERAELEAILAKGDFSPHDLVDLRRLAEDSGAIRRCWGIVADRLADAVSRLAPIPETPAKALLVKTAGDLCGDRRSAELDRLRPPRL
jgi:geranylgeranyl pyrophosphate synthase